MTAHSLPRFFFTPPHNPSPLELTSAVVLIAWAALLSFPDVHFGPSMRAVCAALPDDLYLRVGATLFLGAAQVYGVLRRQRAIRRVTAFLANAYFGYVGFAILAGAPLNLAGWLYTALAALLAYVFLRLRWG